MRIATWNVNSVVARAPRLLDWLAATSPDVLCLQELKIHAKAFPYDAVAELGYEAAVHADGRWNGVAVLSRVGLDDVVRGLPGEPPYANPVEEDTLVPLEPLVEARAVGATCGPLRIWSVYVPNGREPAHAHYAYKLRWLAALRDTVVAERAAPGGTAHYAVCGDFNIAPTDEDVWDIAAFVDATHVTAPERAALTALQDVGLGDVFPRSLKNPWPFTYWDYRAGAFNKNMGMRIDLVLGDAALVSGVTDAYVDREARKGTKPSDHAPVVVDFTPA